jgi:hypothetical protein
VLAAAIKLPDALPEAFRARLQYVAESKQLVLTGVTTPEERDVLLGIAGADASWKAAVGQLHDQANADFRELNDHGVQGFIDHLDGKIRRADDQIDFGFLHVHTNIYRVRQLMLGSLEATRLATSPVVAAIAKGETAVATRQDLQTFFETARKTTIQPPASAPKGALDFIKFIHGEASDAPVPFGVGPPAAALRVGSSNVSVGGLGGFTPRIGGRRARDGRDHARQADHRDRRDRRDGEAVARRIQLEKRPPPSTPFRPVPSPGRGSARA